MNDGILQAAAAMDLLGRMQNTHAQNLANADTVGYRRRVASAEAFASALRRASGIELPRLREDVDFSPGQYRHTGQDLDVALEGEGFFAVETRDGTRFTRNGAFQLDATARLVASDGSPVLGENGPLQLDARGGPVGIDANGAVSQGGRQVGRLRIVEFDDPSRLAADGDGRFREARGVQPKDALQTTVRQGTLEHANVNVVDELVRMISGFRAFEAAQKTLTGIDRVRAQAIQVRN